MKLRKDGRKKADFRELSMNEKLREERERDLSFGPLLALRATLPKGESKRLHQRQKLKI